MVSSDLACAHPTMAVPGMLTARPRSDRTTIRRARVMKGPPRRIANATTVTRGGVTRQARRQAAELAAHSSVQPPLEHDRESHVAHGRLLHSATIRGGAVQENLQALYQSLSFSLSSARAGFVAAPGVRGGDARGQLQQ